MGLKNLFKKNEEKVEDKIQDIPKVIFDDMKLQVSVGQWLGLLYSQKGIGNDGITLYTHLSAEELMENVNIPKDTLKKVEEKFSFVLKLAGIDETETCILSDLDADSFSFNCHFNNAGDDAKISLRYGDMFENIAEIVIDHQNESKRFEFHNEYKDIPIRLYLHSYTVRNNENGNIYHRFYYPHTALFEVKNQDYNLILNINRPRDVKIDFMRDVFNIKNEDELQKYLLGLTFPLEISEVYKKICEISVNSIEEYPSFELKVEKRIDDKSNKTTDLILINNGQLNKAIITRNNKTISIDSNGNWLSESPKLKISQNDKGEISYSVNSMSTEEISNMSSPIDQINTAKEEIEQVKKLTKTLIK